MRGFIRHTPPVLVTGASTGIGYATAILLARSGYVVYAGVRSAADAERLNSTHSNVRALRLDVTHPADVAAAAQSIRDCGDGLSAVVNNAGVAVAGPLEYLPLDEIRRAFEVNVLGALAVTQAVLPLLRQARGRVIFMSSVSGQIAPPLVGPYAASKFALEALADSLRMELSSAGIAVSAIQPGNVRTPIWSKGRREKDALVERMPAEAVTHYGAAVDALMRTTEREERDGIDPSVVAFAVLLALRAGHPRARYTVGAPPAWQRRIAMILPESIRDRFILRAVGNAK